jgi:hypothetical protein
MTKSKGSLYMKMDGFKKISGQAKMKARTMNVLRKIPLFFLSGKIIIAIVLILIVAFWANENIRKKNVEPTCWFSMTGETAVAKGVITKVDFIALGVKNQHDYKILYTFQVGGKTYQGESYQTGLIYRKNEAIDVTYSVKDPSCSCGCGKCPAEDAMFSIIFGGVLVLIAIILVQSGLRRILKTIWIIEHGAITTAMVRNITRSTRMIWSYRTVVSTTRWDVSCEFKDSSGNAVMFNVISPTEAYMKKKESIAVLYDPGMPENAMAVDALPFFVKTDPALRE